MYVCIYMYICMYVCIAMYIDVCVIFDFHEGGKHRSTMDDIEVGDGAEICMYVCVREFAFCMKARTYV